MNSSPPTPKRLGTQLRLVSEWNSQFAKSAKRQGALGENFTDRDHVQDHKL